MLSESPFFFFFSLENVAHTLKAFDSLLYQDETRQLHKHFLAQLLKCILSRCMCVCVCVSGRQVRPLLISRNISSPRWKTASYADAVVLRWVMLVETGQILGALKHHWQLAVFTRSHTRTHAHTHTGQQYGLTMGPM